jgi:hypothetical protein
MTTAISSTTSSIATGATSFDPSKHAARLASKVFSDMDTDTDGSVTKDEFVKGLESKGVSSEGATKQYEAIDKEGTGSITKDDLESAIKSGDFKPPRPQGGAGGPQGGGAPQGDNGGASSVSSSSSTKTYEAADKNEDGTVTQQEQLVYDMAQAAKSASTSSTSSAASLGNNVNELA